MRLVPPEHSAERACILIHVIGIALAHHPLGSIVNPTCGGEGVGNSKE
jgi:hypothetical protein